MHKENINNCNLYNWCTEKLSAQISEFKQITFQGHLIIFTENKKNRYLHKLESWWWGEGNKSLKFCKWNGFNKNITRGNNLKLKLMVPQNHDCILNI